MKLHDQKIVVAIENAVCEQLEASGINTEPFRLDGEKIVDVILEQIEGFVLVPKEPTQGMIEAADNCAINGKITANIIYKAMIEAAQEK